MKQLKQAWNEKSPAALDHSADPGWEPRIVAFCCEYCAFSAASLAGSNRMQYPAGVRIIHAPCTGKIEMEHILDALEKGVDGVLVVGCLEGGCHFVEGNLRARRRTESIAAMLDEIGLGAERLRMVNLSDSMAPEFVQQLWEMVAKAKALGPSPLGSFKQNESAGKL